MSSVRTVWRALTAAALLLVTCAFARADTYPRQAGVDAWHYVFTLEISDSSPEIKGEATIDLRFTQAGVTTVSLDLASSAGEKGMTVTSVTSDGTTLRYTHESSVLRIQLPHASVAGEHQFITVAYHGAPASGLRLMNNKYGEWSAFSDNWPNHAREWLPTIDHPYDKATSEFIVTAPAAYQVVANGLLKEEIDLPDGRRTTHWKQSVPIASWLNALGVERFAVRHAGMVDGVELQTWVAHQDADIGRQYFEGPARQALEFYSEHIGPYPYEKLANVGAAGVNGGMELASAIFYGEGGVSTTPASSLVAHEIAHQWFGDSVTEKDWDDVWLSEGFATYFALLFAEHYSGRDAFVAGLKSSRTRALATEKALPGVAIIHDNLSDMSKVLNQLVYQKAGWVLHMLRGVVGTDTFWQGIREYYRRHRDSNVTTDDLRAAMESVSHRDLRWFFDQWLKRPLSPSFDGTWSYDAAAKQIRIELTQTQEGRAYRLPVEFGVTAAAQATATPSTRVERVEMTDKHATFTIAADTEPSAVTFDPDTWVLAERVTFVKR
jgi:aminopeptidase N